MPKVSQVHGRLAGLSGLALEPLAGLDAARPDWQRLAEQTENIFSTWEWADAWARHLGGDCGLRLHACRRGGEVVAVLPMCVARKGPARLLRFAGYGPCDELGPVCAPEEREAAGGAIASLAREADGVDVLLADRVRPDVGGVLGGHVLRVEPSPVLPVRGRSFDEYLSGRSRNLREQVRRRERKLAREHELRFRLADDAGRIQEDLGTLFGLHAARWRRGGAGSFAGPLEAFHREFAPRALERGWLRLWIMEVDDRPAAAWYGFRFAGVESYYQAGRDPSLDHLSPGFVLLAHTIREAFDDGMREYRFLLGDEPFKGRFAEEDRPVETRALAFGPRGWAAIAAARLALRIPPLRHRLGGVTS